MSTPQTTVNALKAALLAHVDNCALCKRSGQFTVLCTQGQALKRGWLETERDSSPSLQ